MSTSLRYFRLQPPRRWASLVLTSKNLRRLCFSLGFPLLAPTLFAQNFGGLDSLAFTPVAALAGVQRGAVAWGDFDNDNDLDILLTGKTADLAVAIIYRNENGQFDSLAIDLIGAQRSAAAWGDYDNDGDLDFILAGRDNESDKVIQLYQNDAGNFVPIATDLESFENGSLAWGDYDNDGDLDLLAAGDAEDSDEFARIYRNDRREFVDIFASLVGVRNATARWGDLNGDGRLDALLIGEDKAGKFASNIYLNHNGRFLASETGLHDLSDGSAALGDYDSDGDLDIVIMGQDEEALFSKIYRNDGPSFTELPVALEGVSNASAAWGDLDNDGDLDLMFAGENNEEDKIIRLFLYDGQDRFREISHNLPGLQEAAIAFGDYDNDGDLDLLLIGDSEEDELSFVYRNDLLNANLAPAAPANLLAQVNRSSVLLTWDRATDDKTPAPGLTYNVRVGATPNGGEQLAPMANPATGYRLVAALGNRNHNTKLALKNLPKGTYYWSAQALDNNFAGSAFGAEQTFTITAPAAPQNLTAQVRDRLVTLEWQVSPDPSVQRYRIYAGVAPEALSVIDSTASGAETSKTVRALTLPATYYLSVTTVDQNNNESEFSETATASPSVFISLPTALTGIFNGSAAWGDYDSDRDLDVLATGLNKNGTALARIFDNDRGQFFDAYAELEGVDGSVAAWGDYDNDGDLDLALAGANNQELAITKIYRNEDGRFEDLELRALQGVSEAGLAWGDYDNDGDLDLLVAGDAGEDDPLTQLYRNTGLGFEKIAADFAHAMRGTVSWADYDNDADLDVLLTGVKIKGDDEEEIALLYRNQQGRFEEVEANFQEVKNGAAAWGDYDHDGDLDLVITGDNYAKIYRNEGGEIFTDIQAPIPSLDESAAAWGDYDNDGDLDLVCAGKTAFGAIATIFRNNAGEFENIYPAFEGLERSAVAWGDYDNDGDLDILLTGENDEAKRLLIYQNNLDRPNTPPIAPANLQAVVTPRTAALSWEAGSDRETNAGSLTYNLRLGTTPGDADILSPMADLENGVRQVAQMGNANLNRTWVIKNLQGGVYYWSVQTIDEAFAGSAFALENSFVITAPPPPQEVAALPDHRRITLQWRRVFYPGIAGYRIYLDRASNPETVWGNTSSAEDTVALLTELENNVTYYLRITALDSQGNESAFSQEALATPAVFSEVLTTGFVDVKNGEAAWGDFDGDGDLDLISTGEIVGASGRPNSRIYRNLAAGRFEDINAEIIQVTNSGVAWGDYDNDGDLDLLLSGEETTKDSALTVLYNNDAGIFKPSGEALVHVKHSAAAWGDYDNDGDLDLLLTGDGNQSKEARLYRNDKGKLIDSETPLPEVTHSSVAWGDYDVDGDLDILLIGEGDDGVLTVIYQNTAGIFALIDADLTGASKGSAAWGDYDNDGLLDILLVGEDQSETAIAKLYHNEGAGKFEEVDAGLAPAEESAAVWGDYDNDGNLDIIMAGSGGDEDLTIIYRNDGFGHFTVLNVGVPALQDVAFAWGDYDNDRDLDVFLSGKISDDEYTATIFKNGLNVENHAPTTPGGLRSTISSDGKIILRWDGSTDDKTASKALTYNLRVGKTPEGVEVITPLSDARTGYRQVAQFGNVNQNTRWRLTALPPGTYYWSVQVLDHVFSGSAFAPTQKFTLGTGALSASETTIDFGAVTVNASGGIWLDLTNTGSQDLTLDGLSISGEHRAEFQPVQSGTQLQSATLLASAQQSVFVKFSPTSTGAKHARLHVAYNNARDTVTVDLLGQGVPQNLPFMELNTRVIDLDVVPLKSKKKTSFVVKNTGAALLTLTALNKSGAGSEDFTPEPNLAFPILLQRDHNVEFEISFVPSETGDRTAIIELLGDAPAVSNQITLRGAGVRASVVPNLAELVFEDANLGSTSEGSLVLNNTDRVSKTILGFNLTGEHLSQFERIGGQEPPFALQPDESATILLGFKPNALGRKNARLEILADETNPIAVTLRGEGIDEIPPQIEVAPANAVIAQGDPLLVSAKVADKSLITQVNLIYREGGIGQGTFSSQRMEKGASGDYQVRVEFSSAFEISRGIEFKVEAEDSLGNRDDSQAWRALQVRLANRELQHSVLGGSDSSSYRLVSMPLNMSDASVPTTLFDDLGEYDIKKWRLFDIDPTAGIARSNRPYREYPNVGEFSPGKAFMLITREAHTLTTAPGTTVKTLEEFSITLRPGWNMIASPFNFNVPLTNVEPESLRRHLKTFEGRVGEEPVGLEPWKGYLIKVSEAATLKVWPSEEPGTGAEQFATLPEWSIRISAACQEAQDRFNLVGVVKNAALEWDYHERYEAPQLGDFVSVSFPRRHWKHHPEVYTTDYHPESEAGHVWDFEVATNIAGEPVTLRFENLASVPAAFVLQLIDVELKIAQDLREEARYVYASSRQGKAKSFRLLAGSPDFVAQNSAEALAIPATFELSQNFPNPFNPTTTIRYGLPQAARVTITIFNLLGEEVTTLLEDEQKAAGYHLALWNGRNQAGKPASSGVYLYRIQAGSFTQTRKLALVK